MKTSLFLSRLIQLKHKLNSKPFIFSSLQAIFELSRGEQDLIEDLKLARKVCLFYISAWYIQSKRTKKFLAVLTQSDVLACFRPPFIAKSFLLAEILESVASYLLMFSFCLQAYHDPMLKLSIMSEEELTAIFGDLDAYIPLHEGEYHTHMLFTCFLYIMTSSANS